MGIVPNKLMTKPSNRRVTPFIVATVSENANNFGLHGHVLVDKTGRAWEVGRSRSIDPWEKGQVVNLTETLHGHTWTPLWACYGVEIPRALPPIPKPALKQLWQGYKTLQALQEV